MKRVLVFRCENILAAGLESLLAREDDLLVLGVTNDGPDDFLFEHEINLFQPSVVIFDESTLLTDFSYFYGIMKKYPQLRVIVVDEGDNLIHIFDKQMSLVAQSTDLIDVILRDQNDCV